ncbi:hypothetical protein LJC48_04185 [Desulfovibrio sp. OttesenSCG-928-C06]|nr:hypothetical protein [Desulfovibrio sp. OttesenSCG-928-C06]
MTWQQYLKDNTCSADEAVRLIKNGDRVVTGHAAGAPDCLVEAMLKRNGELRGVEIMHMVALGESPYCNAEYEQSFHFNGLYLSQGTREAVASGRADYTPCFFSIVPELMSENGDLRPDVALITVSEPDAEGRVSLGVSIDYTLQAAKSARLTIAAVNPNMPYLGGDALLDLREIDRFVQVDTPLPELGLPRIGEVERMIGHNVASLIPDGACLQLGIGSIPDAVLSSLAGKKDLAVHSEMISDGVMNLVEKGVITGARKTLHPGKIIITFAMGSADFYRWLHNNPMVEGYPVDYVNDPRVIGRNDNLYSINSALSVDLLGQVAADAMGPKQYSGVGGQLDFVRGARFSRGGMNIIAMPASASKGMLSRICGCFRPGQAVTTTRNDVDCVITEFGIAHLKGRTSAARARALINIAPPEFREELERNARDMYGFRI